MKTVGIIGGMGPESSADLLLKIVSETQASSDQEHIPVLLDSNTRIPDRTEAILFHGADPRPELVGSARRLERAGAELLLMACNTAHYFYDDVAASVCVPVLHMLRETAAETRRLDCRRAALLATDGTLRSGVYAAAFAAEAPDTELLLPQGEDQAALMGLIYGAVKAGRRDFSMDGVRRALDRLAARGAERFILGCTELPLVFDRGAWEQPFIDPTLVLARAAVTAAGARLRR